MSLQGFLMSVTIIHERLVFVRWVSAGYGLQRTGHKWLMTVMEIRLPHNNECHKFPVHRIRIYSFWMLMPHDFTHRELLLLIQRVYQERPVCSWWWRQPRHTVLTLSHHTGSPTRPHTIHHECTPWLGRMLVVGKAETIDMAKIISKFYLLGEYLYSIYYISICSS